MIMAIRHFTIGSLLVCLWFLGQPVPAAADETLKLTMDRAVEMALANNLGVRTARLDKEAGLAGRDPKGATRIFHDRADPVTRDGLVGSFI